MPGAWTKVSTKVSTKVLHQKKRSGDLCNQVARPQTQVEEARYTKGTAHSSGGMVGLFASTVRAKAGGRTKSRFPKSRDVLMAYLESRAYTKLDLARQACSIAGF